MDLSGSYFFDEDHHSISDFTPNNFFDDTLSAISFERSSIGVSSGGGFINGIADGGIHSTPQTKNNYSDLRKKFNNIDNLEFTFADFPDNVDVSSTSATEDVFNLSIVSRGKEDKEFKIDYNYNKDAYKIVFVQSLSDSSSHLVGDASLNASELDSCCSHQGIVNIDTPIDLVVDTLSPPNLNKEQSFEVKVALSPPNPPQHDILQFDVREVLNGYVYHNLSRISEVSSSDERGSNEVNANNQSFKTSSRWSSNSSGSNHLSAVCELPEINFDNNGCSDVRSRGEETNLKANKFNNSKCLDSSSSSSLSVVDPFYDVSYNFKTPIKSSSNSIESGGHEPEDKKSSFVCSTIIVNKESDCSPLPRTSSESIWVDCDNEEVKETDSYLCGLLMLSSSSESSNDDKIRDNSQINDNTFCDDLVLDFPSINDNSSFNSSKMNESRLVKFYKRNNEDSVGVSKLESSDSSFSSQNNLSLLINEYKTFKIDPATDCRASRDVTFDEVCLCLRNADLKVKNLKQELNYYENCYKESKETIGGMKDELEKLALFIASLPDEELSERKVAGKEEVNGELDLLKEELLKATNSLNEVKTKYDSLCLEHSSCQPILEESNRNVQALEQNLFHLENEHSKLKTVFKQMSINIDCLKNASTGHQIEIDNLKSTLFELEFANQELTSELEQSNIKNSQLIENMKIVESVKEKFDSQVTTIKDNCSEIFSKSFTTSEEMIDFIRVRNSRLTSLEQEIKTSNEIINLYEKSNNNLVKENSVLKETVSKLNNSVDSLSLKITEFEKLEQEIRQIYAALDQSLHPNSLNELILSLKEKVIYLSNIENSLKQEEIKNRLFDNVKLEYNHIVKLLDEEKNLNSKLKSEIKEKEVCKSNFEKEFQKLFEENARLEKDILISNDKRFKMEEELNLCFNDKLKLVDELNKISSLFGLTGDDLFLKLKNTINDLEETKLLLKKEREKTSKLDKECNSLDSRKQYLESRLCEIYKGNNYKTTSLSLSNEGTSSNKLVKMNKQLESENKLLGKTIEELNSKVFNLELEIMNSYLKNIESDVKPPVGGQPLSDCVNCCKLIEKLEKLKLELIDKMSTVTRLEIDVETLRSQHERRLNTIDYYKEKLMDVKNELKVFKSKSEKRVRDVETYVDLPRRGGIDNCCQTENGSGINDPFENSPPPPPPPPPNFVQMCKITELLSTIEAKNKKYALLKKAYDLKSEELKRVSAKLDNKLLTEKHLNRVVLEDKTNNI